MPVFEIILAVIGLAMVSLSLVLYQTRTHDKKFLSRFWLSRRLLTRREYALNRIGFTIALGAVFRIWIDVVALISYHR